MQKNEDDTFPSDHQFLDSALPLYTAMFVRQMYVRIVDYKKLRTALYRHAVIILLCVYLALNMFIERGCTGQT